MVPETPRISHVWVLALASVLMVGCASDTGDAIDDARTGTIPHVGGVVIVDSQEPDTGRVCFSIALPDRGFDSGESCHDADENALVQPIRSDPIGAGQAESTWVNVFLVDERVSVIAAAQNGTNARWEQHGRVLVVVGPLALATATRTEVTYRVVGRVGSCVFDADGSSCSIG